MTGQRPFLPAVWSPAAAHVLAERLGPQIERLARQQPDWLRRQILTSLAQSREAGRQWLEGMRAGREFDDVEPAGLATMTIAEAAVVARVSSRMLRRLAASGRIEGRKVGRSWLLEEWSVLAYADEREGRRAS